MNNDPHTQGEAVDVKLEYRREVRPVGGNLVRDVFCVGQHLARCEETDCGWICDDECPVEDMQSVNAYINLVDDLLDVEEKVDRERWLAAKGVSWTMTRVSLQRKFRNGRSRKSDFDYSRDTWFSDRTWTRWGARRQIRQHREKSGSGRSYFS